MRHRVLVRRFGDEVIAERGTASFLPESPGAVVELSQPDSKRRLFMHRFAEPDRSQHAATEPDVGQDNLVGAGDPYQQAQMIGFRYVAALMTHDRSCDARDVKTDLGQCPAEQPVLFVAPAAAALVHDFLIGRIDGNRQCVTELYVEILEGHRARMCFLQCGKNLGVGATGAAIADPVEVPLEPHSIRHPEPARILRAMTIRLRTLSKLLLAVVFIGLLWLLLPVYGFFAYRGGAPLPPTGWHTMSQNAPVVQELHNPIYEKNAENALQAISRHREAINVPAISAAVAIGGDVVWAGAAGWADLATEAPATPQTVFRIGSTSKALTGTALARLVDRGLMDLDRSISDYLREVPNAAWSDITARQLASHMAGLPHYGDNSDLPGLYRTIALQSHFASVTDALTVFDGSELLYEPGTKFEYSSLGTVLLGAVIGAAAGTPYRELMRREVLEPAGMSATVVAPKRSAPGTSLATFYLRRDGEFREWRAVDLSHRLPGGGYASTPADLARLGALVLDDDYLSARTRTVFWQPQKTADGTVNEQDYAIGWRWREYEVEGVGLARNANHGGVSRGSQCWLLVFPDYDMAVAVTTNTNTEEFAEFGAIWRDLFVAFASAGA